MKIALKILTVLYGLFWLAFGLNGFLHFFPIPEPSGEAASFMKALQDAGYVMPFVYALQIAGGALLLTMRFVPLALLLLAPVVANILLYDLFLNPPGLAIGGALALVYALLLAAHGRKFLPILKP